MYRVEGTQNYGTPSSVLYQGVCKAEAEASAMREITQGAAVQVTLKVWANVAKPGERQKHEWRTVILFKRYR